MPNCCIQKNTQGTELPEGHCLSDMGGVGSSLNRPPSAGPGLPDKSDPRGFRICCAPGWDSGPCLWRTKPQIFSPTPEPEIPGAYLRVFISADFEFVMCVRLVNVGFRAFFHFFLS